MRHRGVAVDQPRRARQGGELRRGRRGADAAAGRLSRQARADGLGTPAMIRIILASLPLLALAACGGGDSKGKSTTTLDAVEVQPGSVSDSMIILDNEIGRAHV